MDYLSLRAAVSEMRSLLLGRKFTGAQAVNPGEILLSFGKNRRLLLSIDADRPGIYLPPPDWGVKGAASGFSHLLTTRLAGSSLKEVQFPIMGDRVVRLDFAAGWPHRQGESCSLVLEVMGRHSNLFLLDQDMGILAPLKPVSKSKSRIRPIIPGARWAPPPPRDGVPIDSVSADDLPNPFDAEPSGILVKSVRGLSPQVARMALNRAGEKGKEELAAVLDKMLRESDGTVGWLGDQNGKFTLYSFPLKSGEADSLREFSPFSEAAWEFKNTLAARENKPLAVSSFKVQVSNADSHQDHLDVISSDLSRARNRVRKELEILLREEERCLEHDSVRLQAETLLIHAEKVPPGSTHEELPHPMEEARSVSVNLNPAKNARENADHLFQLARRLKRGLEEIGKRKALLSGSQKELLRVKAELDRGNEKPAQEFLRTNSIALAQKALNDKGPRYPGRRYQRGEFTILVGKSARDNEKVTFEAAGPHDLWLHTRDYPGSHVVILTGKKNPPQEVINEAAQLAIASSGAKGDPSAEVMITERKWVRRIKGGKPGQVRVDRFKSVRTRR